MGSIESNMGVSTCVLTENEESHNNSFSSTMTEFKMPEPHPDSIKFNDDDDDHHQNLLIDLLNKNKNLTLADEVNANFINDLNNNVQLTPPPTVEVVISGISGRFPESANIQEFQENLFGGIDMVTDDGRRWTPGLYGMPDRAGKLKDLDKFDASFFGVHAKQAHFMDPQLRMLLELTHESILDAGVNPMTLRGSNTGVFIGVTESESLYMWIERDVEEISGYELTGSARAMFANRISYTFDLKGPSFAVDTACSSSIVALNQAISAIRLGQCDSAIVGGVNLCLKPKSTFMPHKLGMLSPEGKCKAYDAAGNGYARSEGAVVIFIQKADVARRSYAKILNVGVNTDGYKKEGVTFPSGGAQKELLQKIYQEAGIHPADVAYFETHGTGTSAGDPQELNAITEVICKDRPEDKPLLIGSVKSNMGHSEPASGLCSMAKIVVAMQSGVLPANLHFNTPNTNIPALSDGRLQVVHKNTPWEGGIVGLNNFGFGGANSHVILQSNEKKETASITGKNKIPLLIPFSGRSKEAVEFGLKNVKGHHELAALLHQISAHDIPGHSFRGYAVTTTSDPEKIIDLQILQRRPNGQDEIPPVWFIFSGMGSQWGGMGRDLMKFSVFAQSIQKSAQTLQPFELDLIQILTQSTDATFENVLTSFVSITAVQVALVDLLRSIGISPQGIIGHSVGELGCAYADDCLTAQQTVLAAYARGRAILDSQLPAGAMAAVGLSWEEAKLKCPPGVFPACHNSRDSVSISGPAGQVAAFVGQLKAEGIFAREVNSSGQAFHSPYIAEAAPKLKKFLDKIIPEPKPRSPRWISTSVAQGQDSTLGQMSSADYHVNNLLSPVLFQEALVHVPVNALVIEIAPHALLQAILKRSLPMTCVNVGLMQRGHPDNTAHFLGAVGKIFNNGCQPLISNLYEKVKFPVSMATPSISSLVQWDHSSSWQVAKEIQGGSKSGETAIEISLDKEGDEFYAGHKIDGRVLFPATGYLTLVWKTFAKLRGTTFDLLPVVFEHVQFLRPTILQKDGGKVKFQINIFEGSGQFQIQEGGAPCVTGVIRVPRPSGDENGGVAREMLRCGRKSMEIPQMETQRFLPLEKSDVYKELRLRGYDYSGHFQGIQQADNEGTWGHIGWQGNWVSFLDTLLQFSILGRPQRALYLPTKLQKVTIDPQAFLRSVADPATAVQGVPVFNLKRFNALKCQGVEVRGMGVNIAPRKLGGAQAAPTLEEYKFVPYFDPTSSSDDLSGRMSCKKTLRFLVDVAAENTATKNLKITEILSKISNSVAGRVHEILMGQPLFQCDLTVLMTPEAAASGEENYEKIVQNFETEGIQLVTKETVDKLVPDADCHVTIVDHEDLIPQATASLRDRAFLIFHSPIPMTSTLPVDVVLAAHKESCHGHNFYLLRKCQEVKNLDQISVTLVDNKNFEWVDQLKAAMKKAAESPLKINLISQNDPDSGILGLVHCLKLEPEGRSIRCFFIRSSDDPKKVQLNFHQPDDQLKALLSRDLLMNVHQSGEWGSYRHFPLEVPTLQNSTILKTENAYVDTLTRGDLGSLRWIQQNPATLGNTDNLTSVHYAALNLRDVQLATGKLPADALPPQLTGEDGVFGLEFSGQSPSGQLVMGCVSGGALAVKVEADPGLTWKLPSGWTMAEGATVPLNYATAFYSLIVRGQLQSGDSVLIHSGMSGVGQAAISIALSMDCIIFTTTDSDEKRGFLNKIFPQLPATSFVESRDSKFEEQILEATDGAGVDLVLNSLTGDQLLASLRCLGQNGKFLQIGPADSTEEAHDEGQVGVAVFSKNITVHRSNLDEAILQVGDSAEKRQVWRLLDDGLASGIVRPLNFHVYPPTKVEDAFRLMAAGKQQGKVLIEIRSENENQNDGHQEMKVIRPIFFHPAKSYIIVGGMGGLGLELGEWLVRRGAKKLALVSRSGVTSGYQELRIRKWREQGVTVVTPRTDVTTLEGARTLLRQTVEVMGGCPIGGIFNLAVVLRDALYENQTAENFEAATKPKGHATQNLDVASRELAPHLDFFVPFSSVNCARGKASQSTYGFANSCMERVSEKRQKDGLPATAIQWGAVGDVGIILDLLGDNDVEMEGSIPQRIHSCLAVMDTLLTAGLSRPIVASLVLADKSAARLNGGGKDAGLVESVGDILGIVDMSNVNSSASLAELGMDSLMGIEVKQLLERRLDLILSMNDIRQLTINKLTDLERSDQVKETKDENNNEILPETVDPVKES